ncbi:hypothetical protein [Brenneria izbisi]|uniref:Uncharacterized protein n=1 Tax=Brenneria izbisi TaxID=2939450 RepID=A0AA42C6M4_9GAMM|nr:hypothetical protein [Brenneria izbisi]MCV9880419.1 hypothetical protein [Brenneria izbisi]MCV9883753.1 hypothetical protein [Brenneria izbisi]
MNNSDSDTPSSFRDDDSHHRNDEIQQDNFRTATALASDEVVQRFGSASAEYLKGYRGIDNETGQRFAKGLADVAKHKVHPDYAAQNIKQQAGFSAEIAATSRDNTEAIIHRHSVRTVRSDDLPEYGKNHNVVDRVQLLDGTIIDGSQRQMKFVGNRNKLFSKIAEEDGKFARYRGVKLELPSEQFEGAEIFCRQKSQELCDQANEVEARGKQDVAAKLRREADNYDQLADNVSDSGLTTEQAIYYRQHPKLATAMDIARTCHRAGIEGAKYGAAIGVAISLLTNAFNVAQRDKSLGDAVQAVASDTTKAAALGYSTAFAGSALKASLQQSEKQTLRALAGTSVPALAVNICLSLGISVKRYVNDEISEVEFLNEVGEKGAGMLSSGMMAALGQLAIPIPVVGAAIGGMIGYTLSSLFYQSALDAARGVALSRERLQHIRAIQTVARARIAEEQAMLDEFTHREMPQLHRETEHLFKAVATGAHDIDSLTLAINDYATLLGKQLQFHTISEFEAFMDSDRPLTL